MASSTASRGSRWRRQLATGKHQGPGSIIYLSRLFPSKDYLSILVVGIKFARASLPIAILPMLFQQHQNGHFHLRMAARDKGG